MLVRREREAGSPRDEDLERPWPKSGAEVFLRREVLLRLSLARMRSWRASELATNPTASLAPAVAEQPRALARV